ncbi:hypothetical protein L0Z72_10730 [candidate division KSB1 bacterium]|nr:hypothetical protein [candidate division KSB1 bacterium]
MKNAPIRWSITKSPYFHEPPGWDGYYFNPSQYPNVQTWGTGTFSRYSYSQQDTLDANGNINIKYFLEEPALLSSARYVVEGEVTDQNQRRIAGRKMVIIYRGEYHIGLKPKSFFGEKGTPYPIFFISTLANGEIVPKRQVNIQIIRRNWYSVRKAGTGGRYAWHSEVVDSTVIETNIQTDSKPVTYNFLPEKSGYYLMRASSTDRRGNKIVADCSFYILGKDYVAWSRSDDDRIELEKNKNSYQPGDVATIMIKSPFERATALVTIEREGIIDHFMKEAIGSTPTLEIPIRDIYLPNAYVSVMLIQGRTGDNVFSETGEDIAKPAFKLGYINLPVETGRKRLSVELLTDKKVYKPGETVTVNIQALDWQGQGERSEVVLAVVDKGVLNLLGYRFTDLHEYFYRSRPLSVMTSESRLNIIGQRNYGEKGEDRGGSGGLMAMFEARKNFKSTAYWNPSITTNDQGRATVTFRLPDNLTTFVVMAAVHDKASEFGNGESEFRVSQTLVLKPSLPRFLRYNDVFRGGVVVHNYSDQAGTVSLEVNAKGAQLLDHSNKTSIMLTANESREVLFQFKANQIGQAEFTFSGVMGSERDAVLKAIPVEQPLSFEVVALANNSTEDATEKIIVPQNCYQDMSSLEVKAAATQLVGLTDGVRYLFEYPYGCLEQKISSILPMILFEDVLQGFHLPALAEGDYRQVVQKFLHQIGDFQTPTGGFTYWSGGDYPHPYVSAWAVFAMIKAKGAGYKVNKEILKKGIQYLNNVLREQVNRDLYPYTWNVWSVTNCLILYNLALEKSADHGYIEKLYQSRERVPLFGLAYLLKAMKYAKSNDAMYKTIKQLLLNGMREAPTSAHFEEPNETGLQWCFHSNVRTTAHILQSLLELKEELPQAPKIIKWLLLKRNMQGIWRNTQENIYVLHALNTYFNIYEKEKPDFQLEIKLANTKIMEVLYRDYSLEQKVTQTNLNSFRPGKELLLEFDKQGSGRYYYETRMTYYPHDPLPARDQGISIVKKWEVVEGKQMADGSIATGSVIKVTLTVASHMERNYVVIDDPLPAGFEVINTRLKTVSEAYNIYKPLQLDDEYWGGFNFYELRDNKVLVFADNLSAGVHSFVYLCQALSSGDFSMPPTKAEEMYTPEVFGRTITEEIIIR